MRKEQITNYKLQITRLFIYFVIITANFACAAAALASEGETHTASWKELIWPVINFTLLFIVLVKFGPKIMELVTGEKNYFKKRSEMIEKSLKDAEEAKQLAKKTLDETREKLKNTDREMDEMLASAKKAGEKEKEALIAEGERLKIKILKQTKANIDFELQKAKESIKSEAGLMALELAEKQIKERLGQKDHENLIHEYIKKLEARN